MEKVKGLGKFAFLLFPFIYYWRWQKNKNETAMPMTGLFSLEALLFKSCARGETVWAGI
jgi:hypothetical protein